MDIEGWVVERRAQKRPVSFNEMDVSLLLIIIGLDLTPLFLLPLCLLIWLVERAARGHSPPT